jgi:hypothetical protein
VERDSSAVSVVPGQVRQIGDSVSQEMSRPRLGLSICGFCTRARRRQNRTGTLPHYGNGLRPFDHGAFPPVRTNRIEATTVVASHQKETNMFSNPSSENLTPRRYRVAVIEWTSHQAVIEATSVAEAEYKARRLWMEDEGGKLFSFESSGFEGAVAEELPE